MQCHKTQRFLCYSRFCTKSPSGFKGLLIFTIFLL